MTMKSKSKVFMDFGSGQLTSFMFILSYEAGFNKPTMLKVDTPISKIKEHVTMPLS